MADTINKGGDVDTIDEADAPRRAGRMETALASARSAANGAFDETRRVARRAGEAAEANPFAVVAGGIAIGVAAGAFLPKTKRETELLGPVGRRITDAAADAASAAKDAAKIEFATIPLSKEAASAQVGKVLDRVAQAIADAGSTVFSGSESSDETIDDPQSDADGESLPRKRARKAD